MRTDFGFIKLDDAIERGGFDIPLLDQNRLERTHPKIHLGKIGALIMIVIMFSHRRNIANETGGVQLEIRASYRDPRLSVKRARELDQTHAFLISPIHPIPSPIRMRRG